MVSQKIIKEWLDKANEDFEFASQVLENLAMTRFAPVCFHFQQAAEKYLKAFIVANDLEFRKIHDLVALLAICKKKEPKFQRIKSNCIFLNDLYVEPRYPFGEFKEYTRQDAREAKKAAEKIRAFVSKRLG